MSDSFGPDGRGWDARVVEYDLGQAGPGKSIVFNTTRSVFVSVLDEENYAAYKEGRDDYRAFEGQLQSSPFRFSLPRDGSWHVVVDPRTYSGIAEFSVRVVEDEVLDA